MSGLRDQIRGSLRDHRTDRQTSGLLSAPSTPRRLVTLGVDLVIAVVGYAVLGAVGAVIWHRLAPDPDFVRTARGATMAPVAVVDLFGIDAWYAVIGVVLGLVAGAILMFWRSREPVWVVIVSVAASMLAAWVMTSVGRRLGPADPTDLLRHAAAGTRAGVPLMLDIPAMRWAWAFGAALGAIVILMLVTREDRVP